MGQLVTPIAPHVLGISKKAELRPLVVVPVGIPRVTIELGSTGSKPEVHFTHFGFDFSKDFVGVVMPANFYHFFGSVRMYDESGDAERIVVAAVVLDGSTNDDDSIFKSLFGDIACSAGQLLQFICKNVLYLAMLPGEIFGALTAPLAFHRLELEGFSERNGML